jgi:hypothetical protein
MYKTLMVTEASDNSTLIDFSTAWQKCSSQNSTDRWMICPSGILCPFNNETELESLSYWKEGCMWCPENGVTCQTAVDELKERFIENGTESQLLEKDVLDMCIRTCEAAVVGESCSKSNPCTPGSSFCDFTSIDSGICQECPLDIEQCYQEGYLSTEKEKRECIKCGLECFELSLTMVTANEDEVPSHSISFIMANTTNLFGSGLLIDCSDLILAGVETCPGASGRVCLIHDYTLNTLYWQLTEKAERSGCSAVILFGDYANLPNNEPCVSQHSYDHLGIPFVCVSLHDGKILLNQHESQSESDVLTNYVSLFCQPDTSSSVCSNTIPCEADTDFCNFGRKVQNGVYVEGWCEPCQVDNPLYCYFDPGRFD